MQKYGGISRYFSRLAEQLQKMGETPMIVAPLHINAYLSDLPSEIVRGWRLERCFPASGHVIPLVNLMLTPKKIKRLKPDVVHETYFGTTRTAPIGTPIVATVHDMIHELFPTAFSPNDTTILRKRQAVARADHVICVSENTRQDLIRIYGTSPDKVTVVHLAADKPAPIADEEQFEPTSEDRPFLLHVGERGRYKNFESLIRAVASSPRLQKELDIVAFGGGVLTPPEVQFIAKLGFRPGQVRQMSGSDTALLALYRKACAFVNPSLYEGFGLPQLEAMASGCPVIASNSSSMPEVIGNAGELVDATSPESIAFAIERIAFDSVYRNSLIKQGRVRSSLFSWEQCAVRTLEVYRRLVR